MDRFQWDSPLDPSEMVIPANVVAAVPAELALEENVMPVALADGVLTVAVDRPADFELVDKLRFVLGVCNIRINLVAAPSNAIRTAVTKYYGGTESS